MRGWTWGRSLGKLEKKERDYFFYLACLLSLERWGAGNSVWEGVQGAGHSWPGMDGRWELWPLEVAVCLSRRL